VAKKPPPGFGNTPFRELKAPARPIAPPTPAPAPGRVIAPRSVPEPAPAVAADEDRLFEQAMRGVTPLSAAERGRRASPLPPAGPGTAPRPSRTALRAQARRDDALADADLVELVAKPGRLTIEEVGETVAGFSDGVDRRLLRRLTGGDYAIDAEIDLHGLTRERAAALLERTVRQAFASGQRCLLIIHGRGLGSGDEGPVLKRMVIDALGGSLGRLVLAFASAPPASGGTGAVVVLLRKPGR